MYDNVELVDLKQRADLNGECGVRVVSSRLEVRDWEFAIGSSRFEETGV